jgi:hypothetical protein
MWDAHGCILLAIILSSIPSILDGATRYEERFPLVGKGGAVWSFIHTADAAAGAMKSVPGASRAGIGAHVPRR